VLTIKEDIFFAIFAVTKFHPVEGGRIWRQFIVKGMTGPLGGGEGVESD
jgi:hypothetical protein